MCKSRPKLGILCTKSSDDVEKLTNCFCVQLYSSADNPAEFVFQHTHFYLVLSILDPAARTAGGMISRLAFIHYTCELFFWFRI